MWDLVLVVLAGVGLSHIAVDGSIFNSLRKWFERQGYNLEVDQHGVVLEKTEKTGKWAAFWRKVEEGFGCYQCTGWWAGLVVGAVYAISFLPYMEWFKWVVLTPFAASYLSMLGAVVILHLNQGGNGGQANGAAGDQAGTPAGQ